MLSIRLTRTGKKHAPSYRIIVKEKRSKRDGDYLDIIGIYNPSNNPAIIQIDQQKLADWQHKGAQLTDAVKKIIPADAQPKQPKTAKPATTKAKTKTAKKK